MITVLYNSLEISEECSNELRERFGDNIYIEDYVLPPKLEFDEVDYLSQEDVQEVLAKHKVSGRVAFGSLGNGSNGQFWGYDWYAGKMVRLVGSIEWDIEDE